ncbi:hypothetical protein RHMOL_Rhmol06G0293400 [Rhododendron molle]|uniref:Uncharacterized protein n=1 Tax=Rhododendron molle TaxID=49168 RepID=A0ACC0NHN1_RHOML|nr:hypothetical protein RHMOL_Rhmol06G0293400 [Rhododendron molle]
MIGPCGVPFLRSHRKVRSSDKAPANTMHKVGIKTSHIMDFVAQQSGGYESVGYTQKDLYNHFTAQRNIEVADGDAEGALAYLCAKAENDPLFYYKYDVDEQNRLNNLFWRDVTCRTDYMCFGDVLIFDSTYRTNAYRKPLVILAGVNSHFQTAIFGCALLTVETVETYTWVLERFLDSMDHKKPVSVMTDGDKAMRRAIKTVLPDVNHRLCKWHLKKNAVSNVHVPGFLADFEKCMSMSTEEEFEVAWKNLLDDYSLHQNKWAVDVYKKKTLWAEAYLRGIFFAGAKSTQRVEGMNAYMNRFLKLRLKLFEFVQSFDRALAKLHHNEAKLYIPGCNGLTLEGILRAVKALHYTVSERERELPRRGLWRSRGVRVLEEGRGAAAGAEVRRRRAMEFSSAERNVPVVDLNCDLHHLFEFPRVIFASETLMNLRLEGNFLLRIPTSVCLPTLTILNLVQLHRENQDSAQNLLSGCPVLEELYMTGWSPTNDGPKTSMLLKGIANVKILDILTEVEDYVLPTFHNLTHLRLGAESGSCWNWDLLKYFLRCSPNIEVLMLEGERILDSAELWRPPPQVPSCLSLHLREIETPQFDRKDYQLDLIKYLLENAKVLKKMPIGYLD